jgi:hypothetical protein
VNRLILVTAGALAAGSAAVALSMGSSNADPNSNAGGTMNILGEPYFKAVAILHAQGIPTVFGGSVGSDVPQAQCIVQSQKLLPTRKMSLMLNCTKAAQPAAPPSSAGTAPTAPALPSDGGSRPTPGAPGIVTVTPTQVG